MKNRYPPSIIHAGYAIGGTTIGGVFAAFAHSRDFVQFVSFAAAYAALYYFCFALLIGPMRVLRGGRPLSSERRRRRVGIWCGIFALAHVAAGLNVHFGGDFVQYFVKFGSSGRMTVRHDAFGISNYIGLFATMGTVLLLGISNNVSLRKIGVARWKNLQRTSYPLFAAVAIHAWAYQLLERREVGLIIYTLAVVGFVITLQVYGFWMHLRLSFADRATASSDLS